MLQAPLSITPRVIHSRLKCHLFKNLKSDSFQSLPFHSHSNHLQINNSSFLKHIGRVAKNNWRHFENVQLHYITLQKIRFSRNNDCYLNLNSGSLIAKKPAKWITQIIISPAVWSAWFSDPYLFQSGKLEESVKRPYQDDNRWTHRQVLAAWKKITQL